MVKNPGHAALAAKEGVGISNYCVRIQLLDSTVNVAHNSIPFTNTLRIRCIPLWKRAVGQSPASNGEKSSGVRRHCSGAASGV
jgi:hypothetical protein